MRGRGLRKSEALQAGKTVAPSDQPAVHMALERQMGDVMDGAGPAPREQGADQAAEKAGVLGPGQNENCQTAMTGSVKPVRRDV